MLLRIIRKRNNLTIKQVSLELSISESFLSLIEQGKRVPSYGLLKRMSLFYDIDIEILQISVGCIPETLKKLMTHKPECIYEATCDEFKQYEN